MEQYYLGFDAGTQSVKTAVYDIDMNLIVQDTNATILIIHIRDGWKWTQTSIFMQRLQGSETALQR